MYLREKDSITGLTGTPYYIGKGFGNRAFAKHQKGISVPKDRTRIQFVYEHMKELVSFDLEINLIQLFGRIDLGTGCLRNRTAGGDGNSGRSITQEEINKCKETKKKNRTTNSSPLIIAKQLATKKLNGTLNVLTPLVVQKILATKRANGTTENNTNIIAKILATKKKNGTMNNCASAQAIKKKKDTWERKRQLGMVQSPRSREKCKYCQKECFHKNMTLHLKRCKSKLSVAEDFPYATSEFCRLSNHCY